ncbi:MAG: penicillin-insensitive murein endopeptidase, partial [Crocinitomicaceae bacterium]|nr:penicillin-insensitive murein endopeptidase [Crocinitomicaceae bacterium]
MRTIIPFLVLFLFITSCLSQSDSIETNNHTKPTPEISMEPSIVDIYYAENFQDSLKTKSIGSVSRGSLENGTLIPFSGSNFMYFDTASYLSGRAFTHHLVAQTIINTFKSFEANGKKRKFRIMEFSNEYGGKMFPHRTHQNGMSVDMMMPLMKDGKPYYDLDDLGAMHYLLEFNKEGQYINDTTISIDFQMAAEEINMMRNEASALGLNMTKVIFNTDLRDELFDTT